MKDLLKPCPFCGGVASIETSGSCIDIACCCSMSFQKCDYLSIEQRETWSNTTLSYSHEAEQIALDTAIWWWNKRIKFK